MRYGRAQRQGKLLSTSAMDDLIATASTLNDLPPDLDDTVNVRQSMRCEKEGI